MNAIPFTQECQLSCELAAASLLGRMCGYGIEERILRRMLQGSNAPPREVNGDLFWDDPNVTFVGSYNGVQGVSGWGIWPEPIAARMSSILGIPTNVFSTKCKFFSIIQEQIPVAIWGTPSKESSLTLTWNIDGSRTVTVPMLEHCRVVVGCDQACENFYIADPGTGKLIIESFEKLVETSEFGVLNLPFRGLYVSQRE